MESIAKISVSRVGFPGFIFSFAQARRQAREHPEYQPCDKPVHTDKAHSPDPGSEAKQPNHLPQARTGG